MKSFPTFKQADDHDYSVAVELGLQCVRPSMCRIQFGHMRNHQWQCYEVDDVVVAGLAKFTAERNSTPLYLSPVMNEVTYGQLLKFADNAIVARDDYANCFLKGIRLVDIDSEAEVATYQLILGDY